MLEHVAKHKEETVGQFEFITDVLQVNWAS